MVFSKKYLTVLLFILTLCAPVNPSSNDSTIINEIIAHTQQIVNWGKDPACEINKLYFQPPAQLSAHTNSGFHLTDLKDYDATATYEVNSKSITFHPRFFEYCPSIQLFVIWHEMQHSRQFKNLQKAFKFHPKLLQFIQQNRPYLMHVFTQSLQIPLWTLYWSDEQTKQNIVSIVETDADLTAALSTKCYICLKIVQSIYGHSGSTSYLNKQHYTPLIQELQQKGCLCKAHRHKKLDELITAINNNDVMGIIAADKKVGTLLDRYSK